MKLTMSLVWFHYILKGTVNVKLFKKDYCHFLCVSLSWLWLVFLKWACSHSYGEYVFDHSWANAYYSYGSKYYPKLQSCIPFTPVTGARILLRKAPWNDEVFNIIVSALKDLTIKVLVYTMLKTYDVIFAVKKIVAPTLLPYFTSL